MALVLATEELRPGASHATVSRILKDLGTGDYISIQRCIPLTRLPLRG